MRATIVTILLCICIISCNNKNEPDVSGIPITLTTQRFEKDFFDTTSSSLLSYLKQVNANSPSFVQIYLTQILTVDPLWPADTAAAYVNGFIKAYRPVYDSAQKIFNDFTPYEAEIKKGLQHVKLYFPTYKLPEKIITYIGPADGIGDGITKDALFIGLQVHLGKDNPLYKTTMVQETYPEYVSQRFEPGYIAVNCMKNIVSDIYFQKEDDKPLVNQMIANGKRLYILSRLLPQTDDYKIIGYSKAQMLDSYKHEAIIWDLFIKNSLLQITDKNISKNYVEESPKTQELGEGAPGNIGSFAGWQIVKKYMQKKPATSLQELIKLDGEILFQEAKYKP